MVLSESILTMDNYLPFPPAKSSLEATGDPVQNMQGGRCGAIGKRWGGAWSREFLPRGVAPAPPRYVLRKV